MMKILFAILTIALSIQIQAKIYTWVDENGKKHFSDSKPLGVNDVSEKTIRGSVVKRDETSVKNQQQMRQFMSDAQARQESQRQQAKQAANVAERKKRNCKRARYNLNIYNTTSGTVTRDEDGSRRYFSSQERIEQGKKLQAKVRKHC